MRCWSVLLGLCALVAVAAANEGVWADLFEYPYTKCPKVMSAISCVSQTMCYISGGESGLGFEVYRFDGRPSGGFLPTYLPKKALSIGSIAMGGTPEEPHGCVGGIGVGNGVQYAVNATTFIPSSTNSLVVDSMNIRASKDGKKVLVVGKSNYVLFSSLAGSLFEEHQITSVIPKYASGRYGAMVDDDTWYVTLGSWPLWSPRDLSARVFLDNNGQRQIRSVMNLPSKDSINYTAVIVKTTDGGMSWRTLFINEGMYYFNGIDCISATHCVAVAEGFHNDPAARVFVTTDGGNFTQVLKINSTKWQKFSLTSVLFASATEVWIAGSLQEFLSNKAIFYVSRDGGASWARSPQLEHLTDVTAMSFLPDGTGFATATSGWTGSTILRYMPLTK